MEFITTLLNHYRQSIIPILIGILLCLLSIFIFLSKDVISVNVLQRLEAIPYDIRLKLSIPIKTNNTPPIIIVDIDENSLKNEGRWPWSRTKLARLVEKLHQQGTAVIALDILQSEVETNPAISVQNAVTNAQKNLPQWFNHIAQTLDADKQFAQMIKGKEVVLGYPFHHKLAIKNGTLQKTIFLDDAKSDNKGISTKILNLLTIIEMAGYTANLDSFNANAAGTGFFSIIPDADGNVRRAPLIAQHNQQIYPSLALEAARLYLFEENIKIQHKKIGDVHTITEIVLGKTRIPTDALGQILIPYYGKQKHFTYLSATDILHSNKNIPELENAIVLVGTSAVGLSDLRPTPVESSFPGVEIQASILHGILHPDTVAHMPDWKDGATVIWIIMLALLMTLLYPLLQPSSLVIVGTGLLITTFGFNTWLWMSQHLSLPVMLPSLFIMSVSSVYVVHYLLRENKDRKRIHGMFGQYVPLDHINKLIENPKESTTQGERREMSVLFSDIRNFTAISEPLSTRELKTFLNEYLTPITKIVFDNQGTIDKYVGDMVMAFWGAPLRNPDHASHAVISALQMQQTIADMQDYFSTIGIHNMAAGIGIHTGDMNVGDMGSDYRRAYTVLGDAVNLGSRLESLTKFYSVKILVSEDTQKQCPDIVFRYIDYVRVKGKQDAIKIYEPLAIKTNLSTEQSQQQAQQLIRHENAFKYYLMGDWDQASLAFKALFEETQEPLYQLYSERVKYNSNKTPASWSGIHNHQTK